MAGSATPTFRPPASHDVLDDTFQVVEQHETAVAGTHQSLPDQRLLRDFYLGFVRIHVLYHALLRPVYGVELLEELHHHGYALGPGTLYPLLHGLESAGYMALTPQLVAGKIRKYYAITPKGRLVLASARRKVAELTRELLEEDEVEPGPPS